ncbi:MAG: dTDP-4-dehydrorhamnose 3,5-epimerase family protein [Planctomycetes bacterium]|nr:dTDP-4-dehydrorhamnose 3,5-epimerase family protein [Planctomycetota bacterium]
MIKDVVLTPLVAHQDDRGYLIEILRASDAQFTKFGQVYLVGNMARGTIRGFHKHDLLIDWFFISHGSAKFALYDDREDSPTYKELNEFVISERKPAVLTVPTGVYHGWMSLEDDTQLISIASEVYNRDKPDEYRVPFNSFGYDWTIKYK